MNQAARFADLHAALRTMDESTEHMCAAASTLSRAVDELVAAVRTWRDDCTTPAHPGEVGEWW